MAIVSTSIARLSSSTNDVGLRAHRSIVRFVYSYWNSGLFLSAPLSQIPDIVLRTRRFDVINWCYFQLPSGNRVR